MFTFCRIIEDEHCSSVKYLHFTEDGAELVSACKDAVVIRNAKEHQALKHFFK